jgi:transposase
MMSNEIKEKDKLKAQEEEAPRVVLPPLPNYTLSSVCPACGAPTIRRACKVRCERCGFVWDCGEL